MKSTNIDASLFTKEGFNITQNVRLGLNCLVMKNTLAYLSLFKTQIGNNVIRKCQTKPKMLVNEKHSSLFEPVLNSGWV